jgi:hypothetical protein
MKKLKETTFKVKFDVYGYTANVIFSSNVYESVRKRMNKLGLKESQLPVTTDGGCHISNNGKQISTLVIYDRCDSSTVVHESYHCIYRMMRFYGIEDEEAFAYHLDHLCSTIFNKFYTKTKKAPNMVLTKK